MALAAASLSGEGAIVKLREPAATRPARDRFYRPELDMLRLLAFLMVWMAHALIPFSSLLPGPWLAAAEGAGSCGVPIFFFLSAFLITELARREREATGAKRMRAFYVRRALRIWPLYFGVLAVYAILGIRLHGFRIEPGRLAASTLLAGNWYLALHPKITTPMRSLWSISVEEQWYLVWPPVRRMVSSRQLLLICGLLVLTAQMLLLFLARDGNGSDLQVRAWVNSGVQFQYFALGTAAALLLRGRVPELPRWLRCASLLLGFAAMVAAAGACRIKEAGISHGAGSLMCGYALAGAGTAGVFLACYGLDSRWCPRVLVRLGQLSFGLYVFHETGFFFANVLARRAAGFLPAHSPAAALVLERLGSLPVTILLAVVSYRFWELPFLRLKDR